MNWTWLGIVVMVFIVFSSYMGFKHGLVKELVSMFCVVLSIVVVWFINPYVNDFIRENTPVYEKIQESCKDFVGKKAEDVKSPGSSGQNSMLESLSLPSFLTDEIEENNTAEVYRYLAVNTFKDYVSGYLALMAVNGLSFLVSFVLATILIRMVTWALNLISNLPVIKGVNKLAGGVLGIAKAVIFIWVALLLVAVLCNTEIGKAGLELIEKDQMLSFLYEQNPFMRIFMSIFYGK